MLSNMREETCAGALKYSVAGSNFNIFKMADAKKAVTNITDQDQI